jgi:hypothetical protein
MVLYNFVFSSPGQRLLELLSSHAYQISLIWFNVFKGEDLNVKVYNVQWTTERQTQSDDKSSSNLWPGELKTKL